jgi:c-di-GMP-binding flagellar brake protein YcgR
MFWLWLAPVLVLVLLLLGLIAWLASNGGLGFPWIAFYMKGQESGFKFPEINTLRRAAVEAEMQNPVSIFSSIRVLDRTIRSLILRYRARQKMEEPTTNGFLGEIFDFRKRVEFNLPRYRNGIKTSRELMAGQRIRITLQGGSTFHSQVVESLRKYMAVAYPVGKEMPPGFTWKNQRVNVYFWRAEDAGYYFESKVLDDFLNRKFPILYLAHSDTLIRSQKRGSVRVDADLACQIYHLKHINQASETVESEPGFKARLVDLSEDGCALLVGGKAKVGLAMKTQFQLGDQTVNMSGTIRGITFDEKKNRSVLHIQAVPPSDKTRNTILTYVYDIFDERKDKNAKKPVPGLF